MVVGRGTNHVYLLCHLEQKPEFSMCFSLLPFKVCEFSLLKVFICLKWTCTWAFIHKSIGIDKQCFKIINQSRIFLLFNGLITVIKLMLIIESEEYAQLHVQSGLQLSATHKYFHLENARSLLLWVWRQMFYFFSVYYFLF